MGHARALLSLTDPEAQREFAVRIVTEGLSVREIEEAVREPASPTRREATTPPVRNAHVLELEGRLKERFGTRVTLRGGRSKGKIVLEYFSPDEFDRLLGLLLGEEP